MSGGSSVADRSEFVTNTGVSESGAAVQVRSHSPPAQEASCVYQPGVIKLQLNTTVRMCMFVSSII